ncbi:MAG: RNA-binding protein, partial [Planctomycetota bacterium]
MRLIDRTCLARSGHSASSSVEEATRINSRGGRRWFDETLSGWFERGPDTNMAMRIYVGNLPYSTTDQDLHELFAAHGNVISASVLMDRETGRSRGFGFVEMDDNEGREAIEALDGQDVDGRPLKVNEARPREDRGGGGGGWGRGGGGGGGGRG